MNPKYLLLTNFELIKQAMDIGLSPLQFRIIQYMTCCWSHGQAAAMKDIADWVGVNQQQLEHELRKIADNPNYRKLEDFIYENGGNENV